MFEGEKEKLTQFWHELNRVATSRANPMKFFTFWNKLQKASNLGSYYLIGQWRGDPTTRDDALNCLKITSSQWCLSIDLVQYNEYINSEHLWKEATLKKNNNNNNSLYITYRR